MQASVKWLKKKKTDSLIGLAIGKPTKTRPEDFR